MAGGGGGGSGGGGAAGAAIAPISGRGGNSEVENAETVLEG